VVLGQAKLECATHDPLILGTLLSSRFLLGVSVGFVTYKRLWGYLWTNGSPRLIIENPGCDPRSSNADPGFSTQSHTDPQRIGRDPRFYLHHYYDQVFTAHVVIMIFFVAIPFVLPVS
jgi:cytochrome o ubiquinol oxidase subunit 1